MTRSLAIAVLCCTVFTFPSAVGTVRAAEKKRRKKEPPPTTVRAEGASLEFHALALPDDASDESAVLEKLRELKGTLKLEKDVTYRRLVLPAGTYPITIVQDASSRYHFVIGNPPKEKAKKNAPKVKGKKSPDTTREGTSDKMGIAGDYLRRLAADDEDTEEKGPEETKRKSTRKKSPSRNPRSGGKANEDAKKKPAEKQDRDVAEGPSLRARMYFVELEKSITEARFDLKTVESGRKLELSACAGTNCGRARLTFVTPKS